MAPRPPIALFLIGPGGCGKSTLARAFASARNALGEPWCVVDKDTTSADYAPVILRSQGLDPDDRDGAAYMDLLRDLGYRTVLRIAADQLTVGCNAILPAPWGREMADGTILSPATLGLPACRLVHVALHVPPDILRARITQRAAPRDRAKLADWPRFERGADADRAQAHALGFPMLDGTTSVDGLFRALCVVMRKQNA